LSIAIIAASSVRPAMISASIWPRTVAEGGTPAMRSCMRFACSRGPACADAANEASATTAVTRFTNETTSTGDQGISVLHSLAVSETAGEYIGGFPGE
jgi:hypothetical protein